LIKTVALALTIFFFLMTVLTFFLPQIKDIFLQWRLGGFGSKKNFHAMADGAPVMLWMADVKGDHFFYNTAWLDFIGCSRGKASNEVWLSSLHPDDRLRCLNTMFKVFRDQKDFELEYRLMRKDGKYRWVIDSGRPHFSPNGKLTGFIGVVWDITDRKQAEAFLRESELRHRNLSMVMPIGIFRTDIEGFCFYVNERWSEITELPLEAAIGDDWLKAIHPTDKGRITHAWQRSIDKQQQFQEEFRFKIGEGKSTWVLCQATIEYSEDGRKLGHIGTVTDITERKKAEEQFKRDEEIIRRQANYDALTGLPNRSLFADRLKQALAKGQREGSKIALMFIDIDHFKKINDTLGHSAGDDLLKEISLRLTACIRESDTVARLGGDEFTVLLPGIHKSHDAELVARKILTTLAKPITLEHADVFITGSIGISLSPINGTNEETLTQNADIAMYEAKAKGRNGFRFFTKKMNSQSLSKMKLEADLRHAIDRNELDIHYQPIICLDNGKISGAEALLRWKHSRHGYVSPETFIPLAEDSGLIGEIGSWVLDRACLDYEDWQSLGIEPDCISINLSPRQCRDMVFAEKVEQTLKRHNISPSSLILEITEGLFIEDTNETAINAVFALRNIGVRLALDDFGTGYSSLSYLKRFPVDMLKIDRAFIKDMAENTDDLALVEAIIAMAHSLKIKVIGEGAETREQVELLASRGCDKVQGYYFSKPLAVDDFKEFMRNNRGGKSLPRLSPPVEHLATAETAA